MTDPNFILLYVRSPEASVAFYAELLGKEAIEASPTFAMFPLDSGVKLGLWKADTVEPAPGPAGGSELAFVAADQASVDASHAEWTRRGLPILQTPAAMDFGYTFVAADPDGHRLRVFTPIS